MLHNPNDLSLSPTGSLLIKKHKMKPQVERETIYTSESTSYQKKKTEKLTTTTKIINLK